MSDAEPAPRRRFEPPSSFAGEPFWDGTRDQRLLLPWCRSCARPHWYPREVCPFCLAADLEWREATGRGTVHAASTMPKAALPMLADRVPYVVAMVDLAEGVRMMTNIVDDDPAAVIVGAPVHVVWEPLSDGRHLAVFALDEGRAPRRQG